MSLSSAIALLVPWGLGGRSGGGSEAGGCVNLSHRKADAAGDSGQGTADGLATRGGPVCLEPSSRGQVQTTAWAWQQPALRCMTQYSRHE